jgi:hypothetical protein
VSFIAGAARMGLVRARQSSGNRRQSRGCAGGVGSAEQETDLPGLESASADRSRNPGPAPGERLEDGRSDEFAGTAMSTTSTRPGLGQPPGQDASLYDAILPDTPRTTCRPTTRQAWAARRRSLYWFPPESVPRTWRSLACATERRPSETHSGIAQTGATSTPSAAALLRGGRGVVFIRVLLREVACPRPCRFAPHPGAMHR